MESALAMTFAYRQDWFFPLAHVDVLVEVSPVVASFGKRLRFG
jgi:hypothetical protein